MEVWPGSAYPLGATYNGTGTNFALFSERAEKVELCLFDEDGEETRIELDEVTAAIRAFGWPVACAFKHGEKLCAVVEAVNGQVFDEKALRESLVDKLDAYAIPDHIRLIDRMPRNENDKLDRKAAMGWFAEHVWSV